MYPAYRFKRYLAGLLAFSILSFNVFADLWTGDAAVHLAGVRNSPQDVLDALPANNDELSSEQRALHFYLISRANGALALHEKAEEAALAGLALAPPPPLHDYLTLALAEARDGLGLAQSMISAAAESLARARDGDDEALLFYAISVNGYINVTLNQYSEALALFQEGYRRLESPGAFFSRADFASMIALVYEYRQEPEMALRFYREAETWYRQNNVRLELANTLFGLGKATIQTGDGDEGMTLLLESADIALNIRDLQGAAFSYEAIASELIDRGMTADASPFLDDALSLFMQAGNPFMQIKVLIEKAQIAVDQGQPEEALRRLARAEEMATGESFLSQRIAIADTKARAFAAKGEHQSAYLVLLQNRQNRALLQKEINSRRILELQTRFDVEKQRAQNALLEEQNLRQQNQLKNEQRLQRYTIALIGLLIVVCGLLSWLYCNGKRHQKRLEQLANYDGLTGLMTRRKTMEDAELQYQMAQRHKTPLTAAVIDLDHFKQINDKYGHQTGDDVLRAFGRKAQKHFRKTDILGRIGGEEFLFLFPHTGTDDALDMLERFAGSVRKIPDELKIKTMQVTLSVGLVDATSFSNMTRVVAVADEALYEAKETGRDKIVTGQPSATDGQSQ